ncbi:transcriptional regulator [Rhizobium rhizophilum]|uniref:Transcriptional regulator n=1 Tax=Rhizobium rhizophilum TaxID=1850373 RepID=A0ABY2QRU1_9HYPH|nr:transcriptional regulator [Rhizobium rhizophilum]THV12339.1 transcriptional regulator [Rhizobium rhizophilum]
MKKVQRSFAVEYKSGRRRSNANSNSIWGNVDLKSVARAVEEEATPLAPHEQHGKSIDGRSLLADETAKAMLTPPISQHSTEIVKQETDMADENNTMTNPDTAAVVETPIAEKKQRKPRAKKTAPDAAAVEAVSDKATGTPEKQKRGRKPKSTANATTARAPRVKPAPKVVQAAPAASTAIDEMADLLQLEEENQRLRKLLAEKLRTENADLRKKLNLA